jgi:hypothetical protein
VNEYAIINDPGKRRDRAATMIMKHTSIVEPGNERLKKPDRILFYLDCVYLEQFMRKPYPDLRDYLFDLKGQVELSKNSDLLIDADGVGEALIDMLNEKGLMPIPILATGGNKVTQTFAPMGQIFGKPDGKLHPMRARLELHVPKEDLVGAGRKVLEQHRFRVPPHLKWAEELDRQLVHFTGPKDKRTQLVHYNADDPNVHDDFVTLFLLGAWWFTRERKDSILQQKPLAGREHRTGTGWDPMDHV